MEEPTMKTTKRETTKNTRTNILDLLLLARSYAMDRHEERIEEEDLYEALRAYTLDGKPEAIREILEPPFRYWKLQSQRSAGDRPLTAEELRERLARADSAGKLSLSEEAGELALLIHQGGLRLEPAVARRVAA